MATGLGWPVSARWHACVCARSARHSRAQEETPPRLRLIADINSTSASWRARVFVSALMREYVCVFDCVPTAKCGGEGRLGVVGSGGSRGSGLAPGVTACTSSSVRPPSSRRSPRTAYPAYFPSSSPPTSATTGLGGIPWWLGLGLLPRGCFL
jgi:hypothetical protein